MGIGLLAPLFLAGILAIAVPILVHLVHRERKEPLAFPSLMFLRRVPFRSARRQRIRYWFLFLLRVAALLLIATAFARPWLKSPPAIVRNANGGKDVVVMIDRSYSMSASGVWERAEQAAARAVASAGAGDRVAVIAFGQQAELLARIDEPREHALQAVRTVAPTGDVTRYGPAFKMAASVLATARGPAEIIVITDRQRNGWRGMEPVPVPPATTVRAVDASAPAVRNVMVSDVRLAQSTFAGKPRYVPGARLLNRGAEAVSIPVELRMGGRVQQMRTVSVPARGAATVSFDPLFADGAAGEVRIGARDDIGMDDVAYFTTSSSAAPRVRLVAGSADAAFFLESALGAGDAAAYSVQRSLARLDAADLQTADVVVFVDAALPTGTLARSLHEFVRQGGGVVVAGTSVQGGGALMPVRNPAPIERANDPTTLVSIDPAHPIFAPFRASGTEQFAAVRINRYWRSEPLADASVVARFHDGAPALVEQRIGRGRVVFWASSFSRRAGDFVLHPAFVPFAQQLVTHAASGAHVQQVFTVGNVIDVDQFVPADGDAIVVTPGRQRLRVPPTSGARTMRVSEPGIYQLRGVGPAAVTRVMAANVDVSESDLATLPAEDFEAAVITRPPAAVAPATAEIRPPDRERQQALWWYLLVIAFVLLAAETLLANRISSAWRT